MAGWTLYDSKGRPLISRTVHNHTTADGSGVLTNDEHDGYSEHAEIVTPANPAANKMRAYPVDVGGVTGWAILDSAGKETVLVTRTRRMQMTAMQFAQAIYTRYNDAAITSNGWGCRVPSDWVPGTDITVNVFLVGDNTGQANMRSRIGIVKEGDAYSTSNIENFAITDIAMTGGIVYAYARTIPNASIEAGDAINWLLQRRGSDAGDTVNGNMQCTEGAWIEYTAFF